MTKSQMFQEAHRRAAEDFAFNTELPPIMRKSYAHYFRLQLLVLQRHAREARTGMYRSFQIIEPRRVWA
jgi:hypothetical protein